jgi:hypothetical protein
MADDEPVGMELASALQGLQTNPALFDSQWWSDKQAEFTAEMDRLLDGFDAAPGDHDFPEKVASLAEAIEDWGLKAGVIDPEKLADRYTYSQHWEPRRRESGLSRKDLVLLILVALLLMQRGGEAHATALGEAIESNQLQIVAIVIALAAYLRKKGE